MEISAIEINLLTKRISEAIAGYFLSGVYSIEDGALLRFNHASKPEKLVALSSFAPWLTTKNLSLPQASKFVSRVRISIERSELTSLDQVGNERIAKFSFENRKGERRNLYAEFFSRGNLILTEVASDDTIVEVENPQTFRHRKLVVGEKYLLPPSRGVALQEIDKRILTSIFQDSMKTSDDQEISAIKWFGRKVGTSRKFVEEIFEMSRTDATAPSRSMNDETISNLATACIELRTELEVSNSGHILIPAEDSDLDADVCPIVPHSWKVLSEKKLAHIKDYPSLSEALDEVQIQALVLTKRRKASVEARSKAEELASAISKQISQIELNEKISKELRIIAVSLMRETDDKVGTDLVETLRSYKLLEVPKESPNLLRFVTEPRAFLKSFNPTSLASRLFDEAKRLEEVNRKLGQVMNELEEQKNALSEQTKSQEERAERKIVTDRRERQWFERYRWFVSSDGRLIVGGRDATSNSIMINKYANQNDVVFHADLHGSPFFILGNSGIRIDPPDDLALELAQATVSFSRAWKDELGSADAFWVFGDQVKKSAPSGEYLSRGSFFIDGKKNFVRHVKVELAVGVTANLPGERNDSGGLEQVAVVCGPDKSIAKYCIARLKFSPGKEKSSDFARRIKQQLISRTKDERAKDATKKLSIDEIIRVLPAGGYKLVAEG